MAITSPAQTACVKLPSTLLAQAGGQATYHLPGETVGAVIDALEAERPGMRFHLCLETGELRPYVNVFLDGVNIRYLHDLETPIPVGATLVIMPSVAGG
jgi:molybdopterin synthase sulfur carrier subunit